MLCGSLEHDLREHTQRLLVYFPGPYIGACSEKSNHASCNQGVMALHEHHTLSDCVQVDLDPYIYLCMQ